MVDLSVVIPVHNEAVRIPAVLESWTAMLDRLGPSYSITVYDDGSTDDTPKILDGLARRYPKLIVKRHPNCGHGPTILRGYEEATGTWILQIDGDGEMDASDFRNLWEQRQENDLLLGCRDGRRSPVPRRLMTAGAQWAVRLCFGGSVRDANTPYRLMRRESVQPLLQSIPSDTFAPNVLLTGFGIHAQLRIVQCAVPHRATGTGTAGIAGWRALLVGWRSFRELVRFAIVCRGRTRRHP